MTSFSVEGTIGDAEVSIEVEGDEKPAEQIMMDLQGRCDELSQIIEHGIPPQATERRISVDWAALAAELRQDTDLSEFVDVERGDDA